MYSTLDPQELFHLALLDSREGRHDVAIEKLKQGLFDSPYDAKIQFMLAAEYAEIGIIDRAMDGMARAIELDPFLSTARLQLGLLHFSAGDLDKARQAWQRLDELGDGDALFLFKEGLLRVGEGRPVEALPLLKQSLSVDSSNVALAKDISRVLANVEQHLAESGVAVEADPGHLFAHKYDDIARGGGENNS